jgi:hypothetical protein
MMFYVSIAFLLGAAWFFVRAVQCYRADEEVWRLAGSGAAVAIVGSLIYPMTSSLTWALLTIPLFLVGHYLLRSFDPWRRRDPR